MTSTETASRSSAESVGSALSGQASFPADVSAAVEYFSPFRSAAARAAPPAAS
jgi:hypothetical protein